MMTSVYGNQTVIDRKVTVVVCVKKGGGIWICTSRNWKGEDISSWWDNVSKNTSKKNMYFINYM